MRLSTIVLLLLLASMIAGVFQLKHRVQALEDDLAAVNTEISKDKEAIHVLRAEWSYLNRPGRLRSLSKRRLRIAPITEKQNMRFIDLPRRFEKTKSSSKSVAARPSAPRKTRGRKR